MRILVTGAAGFIGSHLCDRLLQENHQVVALDNIKTGRLSNIEHLAGRDDFLFIKHDVSNFIFVPGKVDAVLHFASPASPNPKSPYGFPQLPIQTLKVGSLGTHNALGVARAHQARFLLASTSEVYGDPQEHPQQEDYCGHVDPVGPRSVYDEAKRFAEAMTMAYHRYHHLDTRIVRIFNTYGPRMRVDDGRAVANFARQALLGEPLTIHGDGSQTRSFCYIDDLIEGIYRLLMADVHQPINLGNPRETSIYDLAQIVNRLTQNKAGTKFFPEERVPTDPQRRRPDIGRAIELLGWYPKVDLETGLAHLIEDFRVQLGLC
ncbi:MAG: SDR family oxidoreductase [Chloroflexi bacterium]|nr:SDR family oxidoreductase [Ktedonobacteraceae bacterium]MBV9021330.1 SDR family oxidoreductase [Ktedonobacteraceae bacterium]MBV9708042.1 SDR family oxidoreductase [Chloroflexota bacterium]